MTQNWENCSTLTTNFFFHRELQELTFLAEVSLLCVVDSAFECCSDLPVGFLLSRELLLFFDLVDSGDSLRYHTPASPPLNKRWKVHWMFECILLISIPDYNFSILYTKVVRRFINLLHIGLVVLCCLFLGCGFHRCLHLTLCFTFFAVLWFKHFFGLLDARSMNWVKASLCKATGNFYAY